MVRRLLILFVVMLAPACAFQAPVEPTVAGAAMVMPSRVSNAPLLLVMADDATTPTRTVRPTGLACSAHTYPLAIGDALNSSIRRATMAAFPNMRTGGINEPTRPGEARILVRPDSMTTRLMFLPGFWQATASANVEFALNVEATGVSGRETYRGLVIGTGNEEQPGDCPGGGPALGAAASTALRRITQDYVSKVINSGVVQDTQSTIQNNQGQRGR